MLTPFLCKITPLVLSILIPLLSQHHFGVTPDSKRSRVHNTIFLLVESRSRADELVHTRPFDNLPAIFHHDCPSSEVCGQRSSVKDRCFRWEFAKFVTSGKYYNLAKCVIYMILCDCMWYLRMKFRCHCDCRLICACIVCISPSS